VHAAKEESVSVIPFLAAGSSPGFPSFLSENSHQGLDVPTAILHSPFTLANSNTASGFQGSVYDFCIGSRCTGKERDAETGLDYFGARYLSSAQGRWMSPDWSAAPEPIPFADLSDPQTLNLYGYVRNNPLSKRDEDGHDAWDFVAGTLDAVKTNLVAGLGRQEIDNHDFRTGQRVGDAISAVGGVIEMVAGAVTAAGGSAEALVTAPTAATGIGAVIPAAGVAATVEGVAMAGHGAVMLGTAVNMMRAHGNTAGNQKAELYEKTDKDGNLEKHGVSQDASKRYSKAEVGEGKVTVTDRGPRKKMLAKERQKVETNPGPQNHEPWAGKKKDQ
jgi:RHS repeat-associated protein